MEPFRSIFAGALAIVTGGLLIFGFGYVFIKAVGMIINIFTKEK